LHQEGVRGGLLVSCTADPGPFSWRATKSLPGLVSWRAPPDVRQSVSVRLRGGEPDFLSHVFSALVVAPGWPRIGCDAGSRCASAGQSVAALVDVAGPAGSCRRGPGDLLRTSGTVRLERGQQLSRPTGSTAPGRQPGKNSGRLETNHRSSP